MPMHVMPDFVSEDDLDFLRRELVEKSVAEQHAPRPAQSRQGGIRLLGFRAQMKSVNSFNVQSCAGSQSAQAVEQRDIVQRRDLVEKRKNHYREKLPQDER